MKRLVYSFVLILTAVSCNNKIDPFVETDEGKNVLGFYLDGKEVSYTTSGGFPSEYPYRHNVYPKRINADSLEITAMLNNYTFSEIKIKIAIADISLTSDILDPDITLLYLYKKTPTSPDIYTEGGVCMEYAYTDMVSGKLSFRKWDKRILSGNFYFNCDASQYDGSVKHISVTKGNFDVKFD